MSHHFRFHESVPSVVPWNARYPFPSQTADITKITPRLPPKQGGPFKPGQVMRFEFPAQGYVNMARTYFEFDVTLTDFPTIAVGSGGAITNMLGDAFIRFQNNIQSIFRRSRVLYGSTVLEDMDNYGTVVRNLTEWTTSVQNEMNQTSISEGIGGTAFIQRKPEGATATETFLVNTRQAYIQGIHHSTTALNNVQTPGDGFAFVPNGNPFPKTMTSVSIVSSTPTKRRYCVQLANGMFQIEKLLPTKFMASQFAVELTLATPEECMMWQANAAVAEEPLGSVFTGVPTFEISDPNFIPEILEFDRTYDEAVVKGLNTGGVPLKFSSWHYYPFSQVGAKANLVIQETSRSIKALYTVQRSVNKGAVDTGAMIASSNVTSGQQHIISYQYRAGSRYFPASPVQCSTSNGGVQTPQPSEAYQELAKAIHTMGDYRLSTMVNPLTFGIPGTNVSLWTGGPSENSQCLDNTLNVSGFDKYGSPYVKSAYVGTVTATLQQFYAGNLPSANFVMATSFESSNGLEVSGMNGMEQNDISLMVSYGGAQDPTNFVIEVYAHYDAMLILKANNVASLIE